MAKVSMKIPEEAILATANDACLETQITVGTAERLKPPVLPTPRASLSVPTGKSTLLTVITFVWWMKMASCIQLLDIKSTGQPTGSRWRVILPFPLEMFS